MAAPLVSRGHVFEGEGRWIQKTNSLSQSRDQCKATLKWIALFGVDGHTHTHTHTDILLLLY